MKFRTSSYSPSSVSRREAFTLIELIVVMGIVGILVAGGLAAFVSTANKSRLGYGRDAVQSAVRSARAYAMSNGRNVILVFATKPTGPGGERDERCYRSMAIFDPLMDDDGDPNTPPKGDYVSDWVSLPKGIYFDPSFGLMAKEKSVVYEGATVQMPWIWITSKGTLPNLDSPYELKIEEGVPEPGNGVYSAGDIADGRFKEMIINWVNGSVTTTDVENAGDVD